MNRLRHLALATPLLIWFASQATAQTAAPQPSGATTAAAAPEVAEIVVTARKRSENAQTVAATVQVADEAQIARAGVVSFSDLRSVAPGVNISNAPSPGAFSVTIRGLGSKPGNPSFDSSVSFFVDGDYTPRAREFSNALFDVSGLETLRGTQAALLGKNTSLGAINLITKKPGDVYEADFRYQHEFELNSDRVEGGVNLPVSDTLKFRISGLSDSEGGWVKNTIDGTHGPDTFNSAGRIIGVWTPSSTVDVTGMYQASLTRSSGVNAEFVSATAVPGTLATAAGFPGVFDPSLNLKSAIFSPALGGAGSQHGSGQRGDVTVNWKVGDFTLTSQSGYTDSTSKSGGDVAYLPGNYANQFVNDKGKQFTEEVRLASPAGQRFDYIVGAFFLDGRYINYTTIAAAFPSLAAGKPPVAGTEITYFNQSDQAYSAFGQANYEIYGPLKLTLGLRYTSEKKDADFSRIDLKPGVYSTVVQPPYAPFSLSKSESNVDGSVGLSYQVQPNIMLYTSWGQGSKAGGFAQAASLLDKSEYAPEIAKTTEAGFKSQFDENRLTLNGAVFYTTVHNFQLVTFNGVNFNVGNTDLRSEGAEAQIDWTPVRGLNFFVNATYADTIDTRINSATSFAPRWQGSAGASYGWNVLENMRASADANVEYRSSELSQDQGVAVPRLQASTRLNASIGIGDPRQGWEIRLIGKNLNNEHVLSFDLPAPLLPAGNVVGIPSDPRTVMLQLSFKH